MLIHREKAGNINNTSTARGLKQNILQTNFHYTTGYNTPDIANLSISPNDEVARPAGVPGSDQPKDTGV